MKRGGSRTVRVKLEVLLAVSAVLVAGCQIRASSGASREPERMTDETTELPAFAPGEERAAPDDLAFERRGAPSIVEVSPVGETSGWGLVEIRFDRPIAPHGDWKELDPAVVGFSIDPPVEGTLDLRQPNRLVFVPRERFPFATIFTARIDTTKPGTNLVTADGEDVVARREWSFHTVGPKVYVGMEESPLEKGTWDGEEEGIHHWKSRVAIFTTDDVDLATLSRHVQVRSLPPGGEKWSVIPVTIELGEPEGGSQYTKYLVAPKSTWPPGHRVIVRVDGSLTGHDGPVPLGYDEWYWFSVVEGTKITDLECENGKFADGCGLGPVTIRFSTPIDPSQARHVRMSPAVRGYATTTEAHRRRDKTDSVIAWGEFAEGGEYVIHIDPRFRDIYGQPLAGPRELPVRFVDPEPSIEILPASGVLLPNAPLTIGIETRSVAAVKLRIAKVDERTLERVLPSTDPDESDELDPALDSPLDELDWPESQTIHTQVLKPIATSSRGWSSIPIDLASLVGSSPALVLVEASAEAMAPEANGRPVPKTRRAYFQISRLGAIAVGDVPRGTIQVTDMRTGRPLAGAKVSMVPEAGEDAVLLGRTDANGLFELPPGDRFEEESLLRIAHGEDRLVLPSGTLSFANWHFGSDHPRLLPGEEATIGLTTDRSLYGEGESIRVVGWAAIATPLNPLGIRPLPPNSVVSLELDAPRGGRVWSKKVRVTPHGKFWATIPIPSRSMLGTYYIRASTLGDSGSFSVEVRDFVAPQLEIHTQAARPELRYGETTPITALATYSFVGAVEVRRAFERITCFASEPENPPRLEGFRLSTEPVRKNERKETELRMLVPSPAWTHGRVETSLDPAELLGPSQSGQCHVYVIIADEADEVSAKVTVDVHPPFYLATRVKRLYWRDEDVSVELRVMDFDGAPVSLESPVEASLVRIVREPGKKERTRTVSTCRKIARDGTANCVFQAPEPGEYRVRVKAAEGGYAPKAEFYVEVSGSHAELDDRQPTLTFDRASGRVGETVRAIVRAPGTRGHGVILLDNEGPREARPFVIENGVAELDLEITEAWVGTTTINALVSTAQGLDRQPSAHRLEQEFEVGRETRTIDVQVVAPEASSPRATFAFEVRASDHTGRAARGRVSVWAVDETVLALVPHKVPVGPYWPLRLSNGSYATRVLSTFDAVRRPYEVRDDPYAPMKRWDGRPESKPSEVVGALMSASVAAGPSFSPLLMPRERFSRAPIFIGDAPLDEHGVARLEGTLPDDLTTFRVTALVSAPVEGSDVDLRFGVGEARVRVTRPVVSRLVMPRVLRPGDDAELAVLVDNRLEEAGEVDVELLLHDAGGVLERQPGGMTTHAIDANGQVRVPVRVQALGRGEPRVEARVRLRLASGASHEDAIRLALPVELEPRAARQVALYGTLDHDGAHRLPIELPPDADPDQGGLFVAVGGSLLHGLEDAARDLLEYPHGCTEQITSKLVPLLSVDVLRGLGVVEADDPKSALDEHVRALRARQRHDGGLGYWSAESSVNHPATAYAAWILGRVSKTGHEVPERFTKELHEYLTREITAWVTASAPSLERDLDAVLSLLPLAEAGKAPASAFAMLETRAARLPMLAKGLLALALHAHDPSDARIAPLAEALRSNVEEQNAVARARRSARLNAWYWDSTVRTSAITLLALLRVAPEHPLVPKLVRGLLEDRRGGRWASTQENAYAWIALTEYAGRFESETPDFDSQLWLGGTFLSRASIKGRQTTDTRFTPMRDLRAVEGPSPRTVPLLLEKKGAGRMVYRVGLEWVSTSADAPAVAQGFSLRRTLRGEAGPLAEGDAIERGSLVAVDVEIDTRETLTHLAVEVPIPAGFEAIDLTLGKGAAARKLSGDRGYWVSHQELRRDRAVIYADRLGPGVHRTTVFLRARNAGDYRMPAARAEMMYYPEVQARTAAGRVKVGG
jgi:alpha-2-macroglobulin